METNDSQLLITVVREFDDSFVFNYKQKVDSGGFSLTSNKSFPVFSIITLKLVHFVKGHPVYSGALASFVGLENGNCIIPSGLYTLTFGYSNKFRAEMPYLLDVPKRAGIMFHVGNFAEDSKGCILVGSYKDGNHICNSRDAFRKFSRLLHLYSSSEIKVQFINK